MRYVVLILLGFVSLAASPKAAAQQPAGDIDAEVARQKQIVDRFFAVLERNPRRGTALDRIYGFYVETGELDALVKRYADRTAANPKDGASWMVLGLIESQRGRDSAAAQAFTKAIEADSKNAIASYYLGQSLVLVGQPDKAVEAFETAIAKKPPPNDLLEIFQALGRVHQRAQRTQEAIAVWERLEKLFPGDARVQEEIAATLVEEGQFALALPRYEALLKITKDDYRKAVYRMEASELKLKTNKSAEALADLEALLSTLNPTSWLHREVRRKIDDVFLRTNNQEGLAKYYEGWIKKNPEDVDAMARLGKLLARQARIPEAQAWFDKALKLAPSRKELRLAFIEQLVDDQRFADAIAQYELLDKAEPNNPDYLREWGKLILRDSSQTKQQRLAKAEQIWRRLLAARPNDPLIVVQVADLFRHAEVPEPALELYKKAVELAPNEPQYREYLGEFYHQQKRTAEALATWREIAAGNKRTAGTASRLAEVLSTFGYLAEAIPEIQAARQLDPKDFSLHLKAADLLIKADQYPLALEAYAAAEKLVQNSEESEFVLAGQIKVFQLDGSLKERAAKLTKETAAASPPVRSFYLLARYREALRQFPEATAAIDAALKLEPQSIPSLAAAARIHEQSGDLQVAADLSRKLAVIDRRGRGDYLKQVARLETQLGRTDQALQAGRDLITSAPGNTENYEFYATLCFTLGKADEGLDTLRRAVRVNPSDPKLLLTLAAALAEQFRTDESIELYWRGYEKAATLDDKLGIVPKLSELYLQANQFDRLLERVERLRSDADDKREATICLAQAYHSAGDFGMARKELESLLSENTRDTQLLQQLSKLSEAEGDLADAIKYQEMLARLAPGPESEYRLATLLSANGAIQESAAILVRLAKREEDPEKLYRTIDSLLTSEQFEVAAAILDAKLREDPKNWELLYREGAVLAKQPAEAARRFEALLALDLNDNLLGVAEKNRRAKAKRSTASRGNYETIPELMRTTTLTQARIAAGLMSRESYYGSGYGVTSSRAPFWAPTSYGQARMAAMAWLFKLARDQKKTQELEARFKTLADKPDAGPRALWDWYYLSHMNGTSDVDEPGQHVRELALKLAAAGDISGHYLFLTSLRVGRNERLYQNTSGEDKSPPLAEADLEQAIKSYDALHRWAVAEGHLDNYYILNSRLTLLTELRRAKRDAEELRLFNEMVSSAREPTQLIYAMQATTTDSDSQRLRELFRRWSRLYLEDVKFATGSNAYSYRTSAATMVGQRMGKSAVAKRDADVLALLDDYLEFNRARSVLSHAKSAARSTRSSSSSAGYSYIEIQIGQHTTQMRVQTAGSDFLDTGALTVLRYAFESFKLNDVLSDLQQHLEKRLAAAASADKVYEYLALASFHQWNEDKEAAIAAMTGASALSGQDVQLKLNVAGFHADLQNYEEALAIVETITAWDQEAMRSRETLALNLSVRLGDHTRARQAAERLFGLRLDADTQMQLAEQMRRLGMNAEAEAVLARAQRQVGNRLTALATLMNSYQASGKSEVATQIAYQILRRSRAPSISQSGSRGGRSSDDGARTSAMAVLASAGKLKEMIDETEKQLERSPQATQLYQSLAELYQAAGDRDKSLALRGKMVELRSDDAVLRYAYAQQLQQAGKLMEACREYKAAILAQPRLLQNNHYELPQIFRQAKQEPELIDLLNKLDLKQMGSYQYAANFVSDLMRNEQQRPAAVALFKRIWEAYPESRQQLFQNFHNIENWDVPELYQYALDGLIPSEAQIARTPWAGVERITSYGSDGMVYTGVRSALAMATKSNRLDEVRSKLTTAVAAQPTWKTGPLLIAIVDARQGKLESARAAVEKALADKEDFPSAARWIIGLELEDQEPLRDLVIKLYEPAVTNPDASLHERQFEYTPGPRLMKIYVDAGRRDEARAMLAKAEKSQVDSRYDASYAAGALWQQRQSIADQYHRMGFELDAFRIYRDLSTPSDEAMAALQNYFGNVEYQQRRIQETLNHLTKKLAAAGSPELVRELLKPSADEQKPALDLMVGVGSSRQGLPEIDCKLLKLLVGLTSSSDLAVEVDKHLAQLATEHPRDLSVRVLAAALAIQRGDSARVDQTLDSLTKAVAAAPLEPLPENRRANSRQRAAALQQLAVWVVASECLKRPELAKRGEPLAERALEAARRQSNSSFAVAVLLGRAEAALATDQTATAEQHFTAALAAGQVRPQLKKADGSAANVAPLTVSQFKLGMSIARLAAEKDLAKLAIAATRESLRGGLPVPDAANAGDARSIPRVVSSSGREIADSGETGQISQAVIQSLGQLEGVWRTRQLPPDDMYQVLKSVVLPADRPHEVQLFAQVISDWNNPQSLARDLARWAIQCDQTEDLLQQLETRAKAPTAQHAASALRVMLSLEERKPEAAAPHLQALAEVAAKRPAPTVMVAAMHAAALAFRRPQLEADAVPILVASLESGKFNSMDSTPLSQVTQHYVRQGKVEQLKPLIEKFLAGRQSYYARYGSDDYILYLQRNDFASIAVEVAAAHDLKLTLEFFGRLSDMPLPPRGYGYGSRNEVDALLVPLAWQARRMPAAERYELLRDWVLPNANRRTFRFAAGYSIPSNIPAHLLPKQIAALGPAPGSEMLSTFGLLVEAAREAGKLDQLEKPADQAVADKLPHAELFLLMVSLARADAAATAPFEAYVAKARERYKKPLDQEPRGETPPDVADARRWHDVLLLQAALENDATRALARKWLPDLLAEKRRSGDSSTIAQLERLAAREVARGLSAADAKQLRSANLRFWTSEASLGMTDRDPSPGAWAVSGSSVSAAKGGSLFFDYPLSGSFTFSYEALAASESHSEFAFDGLRLSPQSSSVSLVPISRGESLSSAAILGHSWWNKYSVEATPQATRFFANGRLVYEDAARSSTSPWLVLLQGYDGRATFRNLKLTGNPTIPREVKLIAGDRFDGWASLHRERLPARLPKVDAPPAPRYDDIDYDSDSERSAKPAVGWQASEGVLTASINSFLAGGDDDSLLYYERPMVPGDVLRYEFFYKAGQTHVHPAVGRIAYLLDTDGVREHWISGPTRESRLFRIDGDNAAAIAERRRGGPDSGLKDNDWNSVQLVFNAESVKIVLNGQEVYEAPIEAANERCFGFFRYRSRTSAKVRNVVLTGNWPNELTKSDLENLLAPRFQSESASLQSARLASVPEANVADQAYDVWRAARKLAAQERYDVLRSWVLPNESHAAFRLQADFIPVDQPSALEGALTIKGSRQHTGGELVAPAMELVRAAAELKKLKELADAARQAEAAAPDGLRNRLALEVLIAAARNDDAAAAVLLKQVLEKLKALDPATPPAARYPEVVAVLAALERPALRAQLLPIAELLVENQQSNYQTLHWEQRVRWLRAKARWLADPKTAALRMQAAPVALTQWTPVSHPNAESRGRGLPPATWKFEKGRAEFFTGQGGDSLYFQSPLTGNFEVRCRRSTFGWKEIRLLYAGIAFDVQHEGRSAWRIPLGRSQTQIPFSSVLENWGEAVDYRFVMQEGQCSIYFNNRQVHSERSSAHADPWLTIQTAEAHFNGWIENLQILGAPTIPDQIKLSAANNLFAWRGDYYGDEVDDEIDIGDREQAPWAREQDEIVGRLSQSSSPGKDSESVLYYHRPMLEDGELEYEFFYEPGKYEVHPTLDRAAFLLSPEGVKLHYLTDGAYDRSGLAPDNAKDLAGSQKPALKARDWNKLRLKLSGDLVTLSVNDVGVAEHKLEPTNQRLFGLFRFGDRTASRVKNVVYRGQWPKTLPGVAQQQLAAPLK